MWIPQRNPRPWSAVCPIITGKNPQMYLFKCALSCLESLSRVFYQISLSRWWESFWSGALSYFQYAGVDWGLNPRRWGFLWTNFSQRYKPFFCFAIFLTLAKCNEKKQEQEHFSEFSTFASTDYTFVDAEKLHYMTFMHLIWFYPKRPKILFKSLGSVSTVFLNTLERITMPS